MARRKEIDSLPRILRSRWPIFALALPMILWGVWSSLRSDPVTVGASTLAAGGGSSSDQVAEAIAYYEHELRYNRGSDETADNLYLLATLYFTERADYSSAALHYETLSREHPHYGDMKTVYSNLVACYEKLGRSDLRRSTLMRMMDRFPPGSDPHLLAKQKLGL